MSPTRRRRAAAPREAAAWLSAALLILAAGCATAPAPTRQGGEYAFWPPFPDEPRIQFLVSYRFSEDVEPPRSNLDEIIYGKGRRVLPIAKPYGLEMWEGKIYVCDTKNAGVVVLDLRKQETRLMGVTGPGRLSSPTDVAIAPDGTKYVTDSVRGVVFVYDADEHYVTAFGFTGFRPTGIDVSGDELFVCDFESRKVIVFDRYSGERKRDIGLEPDEPESLGWPLGLAVDPSGDIYVTDVLNCRVRRFSPEGELLTAFGQTGTAHGSFVRPKHVAVDSDGIVYVVDAGFQNVQMFNESNRLLTFFGLPGSFPGAMQLPAGVCTHDGDLDLFEPYVHPAFEAERLVIVTNQFGVNKVSVYALGKLREGKTVQDLVGSLAKVNLGAPEGEEAEGQEGAVPQVEPGAELRRGAEEDRLEFEGKP